MLWLRLPGHGTSPRALAEVAWQDWTSAVEIAIKELRRQTPADLPLMVCGYSNGGALAMNYVLTAISDAALPQIGKIVLFSPMIGINPLAKMTRLYHMVGLVSRNPKTKWSSVYAEIDPFKYSSWPMNANVQAWGGTRTVERKLAALEKSGKMTQLPPVLAMQSVVDSTVVVSKLITVLFDRLTSESSELFLFDVNRMESLSNLLNLSFEQSVKPTLQSTSRPYTLTVMRNRESNSEKLMLIRSARSRVTEQLVGLSWPEDVVSLSHVAVPFPPNDPIYGDGSEHDGLTLGSISIRAEPSALMIPSSLLVRCRYNPFYQFMEDRVIGWLSQSES